MLERWGVQLKSSRMGGNVETEEQHEEQRVKDEQWFSNYSWRGKEEKEEVHEHGKD